MNSPLLIPIAFILIHFSANGYAQYPGGVSANLTLWMKAESATANGGGRLTGWPVSRGTNTFATSGTAANITTVANTINFHPVVHFAGAAKLVGNKSIQWSECTAVTSWTDNPGTERGTVISPTISGTATNDASRYYFRSGPDNPGSYLFAGMGVDSIGFEYIADPPAKQVNILTASGVGDVFNKNGLDARLGSLFGGFTKRATVMNSPPQIGDRSTNDSPMKGDIAEIIVYGADNATNRNKVESYLALKYGLTLGNTAQPVSYTSSAGTIFWTGLAAYQHNIFGIGTDLASGLTQSQSNSMNSGSGTGAGQSGRGNLVLNAIGSLSDQQFLMIGTDSASLREETITAAIGPSVAINSQRLIRTWKVNNINSVGNVNLSFNTSALGLSGGSTAANYWLLIDTDGDGNFNTGTINYDQASSLSGNVLTFNPVSLNNNAVFTILTKPSSMTVLTIDWHSFTASAQQNTVSLQWTVGYGTNIDRYEIERSLNGTDFIKAGSLPARTGAASDNGTDGDSYTFMEQLSPGNYYYRIRMIDKDGNYQLSEVRSVTVIGQRQQNLQIRSNPVIGNILQLEIDLPQNNTVWLRIADRQGNIILQKQARLQQGSNTVPIDLTSLAGGLYFVQLQAGKESNTLSFLK